MKSCVLWVKRDILLHKGVLEEGPEGSGEGPGRGDSTWALRCGRPQAPMGQRTGQCLRAEGALGVRGPCSLAGRSVVTWAFHLSDVGHC